MARPKRLMSFDCTHPLAGESSVSKVRVKRSATLTASSHNKTLTGRPLKQ